jgi:ATP phosphoribosyltransferase
MITLALSKGRIFEEVLPFLAAAGIRPLENPEDSRKLMIGTNREDLRIVVLRATDVPTYVQYGAADLGVAGWDSLYEHGGNGLYVPVDLGIARCRMSAALTGTPMCAAAAAFAWRRNTSSGRVTILPVKAYTLTSSSFTALWNSRRLPDWLTPLLT